MASEVAVEQQDQEFAVKQFIELCNNLGANCSTATSTGTAAGAAAAAAASSSSNSSNASTSNFHITINSTNNTHQQQSQSQLQQIVAPETQIQTTLGGGGGGGGGGALSSSSSSSLPIRRHISHTTAVKFLYARKFDIQRAVSLYEQHEQIRQREYLYNIDADVEPLRSELQTGKFTILPARTSSGAAIALFTANRHSPLSASHTTTLQGIVYQLDCALQDTDTQRAGLVFIYDMSGSKYSNFDYDLSQKILTLLKGGYPARLKKVLIVTAPLWFKAPFKILRLFVREKLRERVFTVSVPQLSLHVPRKALPVHLGGTLEIDHATWLLNCRKSMTNREDELLANLVGVAGVAAATATATTATPLSNGGSNSGSNNAAAATTIISAVHQLSDSNTTVVTVSGGAAAVAAGGDGGAATGSAATGTQQQQQQQQLINTESTEPNENITINGLSPSHRTANNTLLKLNTSGIQQQNGTSAAAGAGGDIATTTATSTTTTTTAAAATTATTTTTTTSGGVAAAGGGVGVAVNGSAAGVGDLWSENPPSSASSGFSDDDSLAGQEGDPKTLDQIVQMVKERRRQGLIKEYLDIRNRAPEGTFLHARMRNNLTKNRYTDVLCYDHSRVVLAREDEDELSDYINANFVDGYKQKNAYISTQGPLPKTSQDFWRMIWEQHCLVIVMTTRVMERGRVKCGQYWEPTEDSSLEFGNYHVRTISVECNEDYTVASLELRNLKTDEIRNVSHWQFTSWPDYGVPSSAMAMLNFLQKVRDKQAQLVRALGDTWAGHVRGPPIVVHCSAGIGRTGTFITLDICISRLEDVGTADIRGTVEKIRSQRAYSIQMPDQYVFCHLALIEYAHSRGMLQAVDLAGFDEREQDSE
ncbi:tyrosine-protein phosphatase non-receptor type 9 isoform X2 [Drosophila sulfurigaster albostrigata]|uniref:tyrosine-protein phosphatase non-receptor type 9 isoform X2 n=1 Tax=Drosophila sulfurigaster albostrigata TaxID=89887 RepID=UPI002D21C525|nr:tyrosine-protein phosphatase non-receptor type 9 isoform X2 [Drosophila sulfurigaster albostrigata]